MVAIKVVFIWERVQNIQISSIWTGKLGVEGKEMIDKIILGAAAVMLVAGNAGAEEKDAHSERYQKAMAKYERTGEMKRCISPIRLRHTNVLDDNHIIFEVSGKKAYLNKLSHRCHSLGFHRAFTYEVRGNRICKRDRLSVLDTTMPMVGPSCFLGEFEEIKKIPRDAQMETTADTQAALD